MKPLLHKQWISSNCRAGEQKKKRKKKKKGPNHPSVESWSLPCVELRLNTEQPREASTIPGKIFITATNLQVSRTGEQDSVREKAAISTGSDFMLLAVFPPAAETNPTQPPPLFFHCAGRLPLSMAAHKRDCMQKVAITLRRVNLSSVSHQEERDRISSPDESSICRSVCH